MNTLRLDIINQSVRLRNKIDRISTTTTSQTHRGKQHNQYDVTAFH